MPCQAAKAMTVCPGVVPDGGSWYTSGPPGPDMPDDVESSGSEVDMSVHGAAGPEAQ